ncbi:MAG: (Fe-S)-binding protein [Bacteroidales bacterium]
MMERITDQQIEKGLEMLKSLQDGKLMTHVNSCVHCGLCGESCLYYLANKEARFLPAMKVDLVSSVYKRYFTFTGRVFPKLINARDLDQETTEEMVDLLFGACTMCGRCNIHCSIGVDIAFLVRTGRMMLTEMGLTPATLQSTVNAALTTGNNMGITKEEFVDTLNWLEEDLRDEVNDPEASIPLNEKGKELMYTLNPREPKFFPLSISAMAKVFYAAKESWTLSTEMYDVTNYAFFSGNPKEAKVIADRMHAEFKSLGAKELVLAECGHGDRAYRWEAPNYMKTKLDYKVYTSVELLADYIKSGRIKVDKEKIKQRVTLHDPCNLARNGGVVSEQRYVLSQTVSDFVEMTPHGIDNLCCGGGGGQLAMSEYNERRMKIGRLKADQIRNTGAQIVVTPCHNCVDQLSQLNSFYKLDVQIKTLAEIVADALIID